MAYSWTCPYCGKPVTIQSSNWTSGFISIGDKLHNNAFGTIAFRYGATCCPNDACRQVALECSLVEFQEYNERGVTKTKVTRTIQSWKLMPDSMAKPQQHVPPHIVRTYEQACRIVALSPDASATMSRRCLQAMIRDFWDVKGKPNLFQEIEAIKEKVGGPVWKAIHAVRDFGNIGAHMEQDVNLIQEVDNKEAEKLIALIEFLFRQWYDRRAEDEALVAGVIAAVDGKKKALDDKKQAMAAALAGPAAVTAPDVADDGIQSPKGIVS